MPKSELPFIKTLLATAGLMLLAAAPRAQEDTSDIAVAKLAAILNETTTLSAKVEQLLIDQEGRELQEASAYLHMSKPASFHWETLEPFQEVMVTDGELIWRYEPDLEQVTIQIFNKELDRTPVTLLNGSAETIAAAYAVEAVQMEDSTVSRFILLPLHPGNLVERLSLTFEGLELVEMQFEDSLGQKTSLSFHAVLRNQAMAAGQFSFTPPSGVEIIDHRLD